MSCLVRKVVVNPRYKKIAPYSHFKLYHNVYGQFPKNDYYINVDCGRCINCFRKYMSAWRFRLLHELINLTPLEKHNTYYVTLTMSDKYYNESKIALKKMVRLFLERVRKHNGSSIRHFLVTERGDDPNGTHRIHFHGFFINTKIDPADIYNYWKYGFVDVYRLDNMPYSIGKQVSYCTSYITKGKKGTLPDIIPPGEMPLVLASPGLGASYVDKHHALHHQLNGTLNPFAFEFNGTPRSLPRYLRQKVFSDTELLELKNHYFDNIDDDVISDGPYYVGNRLIHDYTQYDRICKQFETKYNKLYGKQHFKLSTWSKDQ